MNSTTIEPVKIGRNVERIRCEATRVIRGRVPMEVRRELNAAVKSGLLGHLKKDGLKPEIYFHPDHKNGAIYLQKMEAAYAITCIAKVLDGGVHSHVLTLAKETMYRHNGTPIT